jgi:hypothetical protein
VAESVGKKVGAPGSKGPVAPDERMDPLPGKAFAARRNEKSIGLDEGMTEVHGGAHGQIRGERLDALATDRHDTLLVPLPAHASGSRPEIDVAE